MASEGVVRLRTGFEMSAGDYEAVIASIKDANLSYACFGRSELMRKILDPEYPITGYTRSNFIEKGLLQKDGSLDKNTREVLLASLPIQGSELEQAAQAESCPIMIFRDDHLLAHD